MSKESLVIAFTELEEDVFNKMKVFDDAYRIRIVVSLDDLEESLCFTCNDEKFEFEMSLIEWYKKVDSNSDLANYARKGVWCECEWDEEGNLVLG